MKDYEAYLFDWDGTLARTTNIWLSEIMFCAKAFNIGITPEENARHFGDFDIWEKYGVTGKRYDDFQHMVTERVRPRLTTVELFADASAALQALKDKGKKLGLVTSSRRDTLAVVTGRHGLTDMFDVVVCIEDVHTHKPDPEGIAIALERLQVSKEKALMLGDTDKDIRAAHNAGIDSLLFYPKEHEMVYDLQELKAHKPKRIVYSWRAFLDELQ